MATKAKYSMTEDEVRNFMLSSLASTQAMLAVVLDTQAIILAKLHETPVEHEKEAIIKALCDAEAEVLKAVQTPEASPLVEGLRKLRHNATPSTSITR